MLTSFRKLSNTDIASEYKIMFTDKHDALSIVLIKKSTNTIVDFLSLKEPINNKKIHPCWYNHNVYFIDIEPTEHPLSQYKEILERQLKESMSMMEFMIFHNDTMKEKYINSLQYLTLVN